MNKVKEILAPVLKYHFWILCVLLVLMGFGSWYMATSSLDAATATNADAIKAADGQVQQVSAIPNHPNDNFKQGMDGIITTVKFSLANGWRDRYKQQAGVLIWPASLTQEFIAQVDPLRPIEGKIPYPTPPELEIPVKFRTIYRNFITDELPKLAKSIGATWYPDPNAQIPSGGGPSPFSPPGGGDPRGGPLSKTDKSVVRWNEANQKEILLNHFPFTQQNGDPTTLQVLYAQEDVWVLESLMRIIKATNGDVDANYDAAIKEIELIAIGKTVGGRMGMVSPIVASNMSGTSPTGPSGIPGIPPPPGMPTAPGMPPPAMPVTGGMPGVPGVPAAPLTPLELADPAYGRYVDVDYNPLAPAQLREAMKPTAPPELAIYGVAKRIPVRMRLLMDQRQLNTLLANCGNSRLPVEVRQVRLNCPAGLVTDPNAFAGTMPSRPSPRPQRPQGIPGDPNKPAKDDNDMEVEVYGIVYIYNPADEARLGVQLQEGSLPAAVPPAGVVPPGGAVPPAAAPALPPAVSPAVPAPVAPPTAVSPIPMNPPS